MIDSVDHRPEDTDTQARESFTRRINHVDLTAIPQQREEDRIGMLTD